MNNGGEICNMGNDREILAVISPQKTSGGVNYITGPYIVVGKDITARWAVAALGFNDEPCLGIRWFTNEHGAPSSRGNPVWFIIPRELSQAILDAMSLDVSFIGIIRDFLSDGASKLTGEELAVIGALKGICALRNIDEQRTFALCYMCYNKMIKERDAKNREKQSRRIKEELKAIETRFNAKASNVNASNKEITEEIEKILEGDN
jgi:hypothetical protein